MTALGNGVDVKISVVSLVVMEVWVQVIGVMDENASIIMFALIGLVNDLAQPYCDSIIDTETVPDEVL